MNDILLFLGTPALIGATVGNAICHLKNAGKRNDAIELELLHLRKEWNNTSAAIHRQIDKNNEDLENRICNTSNEFLRGWMGEDVNRTLEIHNFCRQIIDIQSSQRDALRLTAEWMEKLSDCISEIKDENAELKQLILNGNYRTRNVLAERIYKKGAA